MASSLVQSFLAALAASVSVLLTLVYGLIAGKWGLLRPSAAKDISRLCVKMFLPALLITTVGSELHAKNVLEYWPVVVWSLLYTVICALLGFSGHRYLGFPRWIIVACAFNNTTSLPLLLISSLKDTSILDSLLWGSEDTREAMMRRAQSYVLISCMVNNVVTFAIGPKLLGHEDKDDDGPSDRDEAVSGSEDESTALLPVAVHRGAKSNWEAMKQTMSSIRIYFKQLLPKPVWKGVVFFTTLINPPLVGALIALLLGLVPPFHKAFFEPSGFFRTWLTKSLESVGDLFTALQMFVVGSQLSKKSAPLGMAPLIYVFVVRFVLPAASIPLVLASRGILRSDPMFWFILCIMAVGPPAINLASLAEMNGVDQKPIARLLTIMYVITPIVCIHIVASLTAIESVKSK